MLSMKHKKHIRMGDKLLTYCFLKWKYLQYVINCLKGLKQFKKKYQYEYEKCALYLINL